MSQMLNSRLMQGVWFALAASAVGITSMAVVRDRAPHRVPDQPMAAAEAATLAKSGIRVGPSNPTATVIEFADFECHFCRDLQATMAQFRARHPDVLVVFRHFPLSRVGLSVPSAAAAECAAAQGRFAAFADTLFLLQRTLSQVNVALVARRVGIRDTVEFNRCRSSGATFKRIQEDVAAGKALRLRGTPSLIIGDQLISRAVTLQELESLVDKSLKGAKQ